MLVSDMFDTKKFNIIKLSIHFKRLEIKMNQNFG